MTETDTLSLQDYLERGGKLSSPLNVPARYRGELLRIMTVFIDSELAASAGFVEMINKSTGIKQRINACRIVQEKAEHAQSVLALLQEFGVNTDTYASQHPWDYRIGRGDTFDANVNRTDNRLSVFYYPLSSWVDAVVLNVLMGLAADVQLDELRACSYQPLAQAMNEIRQREHDHTKRGWEELTHLIKQQENQAHAQQSVLYWAPKIQQLFSPFSPERMSMLKQLGLRTKNNPELAAHWLDKVKSELTNLKLNVNF